MAKEAVIKAIQFLEGRLEAEGLKVSKIILFGSHAKGEATEESDIDIIIVSDDFKDKDIFERARMTKQAELMTIKRYLLPMDIITMTAEELESETSLVADYAKDGEVVYAA